MDRLTVARGLAYLLVGAWCCSVETSLDEPAVMVLPVLVATILALDVLSAKRDSVHDARLSRVVLTGWLAPVALVVIVVVSRAAAWVGRMAFGWGAGVEPTAMIAEMGRPLSWVERLTPGFVMLWVLAVAVAAAITARWPRHQVGWVQAFATLVAAPLLLMR